MKKTTKLLLHACCAPCASAVLEKLLPEYELTLFYFNPNIQPETEYQKRLREFSKLKTRFEFSLLAPEYDDHKWSELAKPFAAEPEGGNRCQICFDYRLEQTAALAGEYAGFATTLSISPYKNLEQINSAGQKAARKFNANFLDFNFQNLYPRSVELSKKLNLYRQKYCGCLYAKK